MRERKRIDTYLPLGDAARLSRRAADSGVSVSALVARLIYVYLDSADRTPASVAGSEAGPPALFEAEEWESIESLSESRSETNADVQPLNK